MPLRHPPQRLPIKMFKLSLSLVDKSLSRPLPCHQVMLRSEDEDSPGEKVSVDAQQRYCGNVKKYLQKFKGNMPSKKKHVTKHKGRHGAASMQGMGGSADLKLAQKALSKGKAKSIKNDRKGGRSSSSSHGGKRGKR